LIGDAHTTESIELASGGLIEAEAIIQDLNYVISGLSYPGRTNRTLSAQDMDFSRV
jgi:hypothetical protein